MLKVITILFLCNIALLQAFDCENAGTMSDIKSCSYREFAQADKELNVLYKQVMNKLDSIGKQKLRKAQRAWIVYRDAKAEFSSDWARGGTLAGYLESKSRIKSTKQRIEELKYLLESIGKEGGW